MSSIGRLKAQKQETYTDMTKFERLLEAKNEAERLGAILMHMFPEKKDVLYKTALKYVNQFESYAASGDRLQTDPHLNCLI